jgi:uncharacterized protein YgbK (DUF1537 family)
MTLPKSSTRKPLALGCIADDFTGATDLANNLVRSGMRTVQLMGVPKTDCSQDDADAVVVALKSRTIPAEEAIAQSLAALEWLLARGAEQIYFKYCSTFDSTPKGNIGPVAEALMKALGTSFTIATPAFPENQRSVFQGHLFVGSTLLEHTGMRDHPLTPMTDSNLVRVLQAQCRQKVGLVDAATVAEGSAAIGERMLSLQRQGVGLAIVDAISNRDLLTIGAALKGMRLVTGGSGVAIGLAQNFGISPNPTSEALPKAKGKKAVVSGSCSVATQAQVAHFIAQGFPSFQVHPAEIDAQGALVNKALAWAASKNEHDPILIYSTSSPGEVKTIQDKLGVGHAGELVETTLAAIAKGLVYQGVRQLLVAGGETSGACVQALGIDQMQIGPQIDPGVPWCWAQTGASEFATPSSDAISLHLALKSGNFGTEDFFIKSFGLLK